MNSLLNDKKSAELDHIQGILKKIKRREKRVQDLQDQKKASQTLYEKSTYLDGCAFITFENSKKHKKLHGLIGVPFEDNAIMRAIISILKWIFVR